MIHYYLYGLSAYFGEPRGSGRGEPETFLL